MLLFGGLACVAIMFVHVDGKSEIYHFDFCAFVVKRLLRLDAYLKYHLRSNIICVDLKTSWKSSFKPFPIRLAWAEVSVGHKLSSWKEQSFRKRTCQDNRHADFITSYSKRFPCWKSHQAGLFKNPNHIICRMCWTCKLGCNDFIVPHILAFALFIPLPFLLSLQVHLLQKWASRLPESLQYQPLSRSFIFTRLSSFPQLCATLAWERRPCLPGSVASLRPLSQIS